MHISSHCPDLRRLRASLQGATPVAEADAVKAHVEQCPACQTDLLSSEQFPDTERIRSPKRTPADAPPARDVRHGREAAPAAVRYPWLLPPAATDEIGRLGSYRVLRLLGEGGMGLVFLAEDIALSRPVALKVMKPELGDVEGSRRFLREARTMAAIKHEHLVTVFQAGQEGGVAYFAMELLQGQSLEDRMSRGPRAEVGEILRLGREIASGLAFLHREGLVHRDIKPANLWLEAPHGRVKILDLGLARLAQDRAALTEPGILLGTPAFMSPEQARGVSLDARSDLFSLGCVLYCLCTGERPFPGTTAMAVLTALAMDDPRPARERNPAIPGRLSDLVGELLAKRPGDRPPSADAVRERLERIERELKEPHRAEATAETRVMTELAEKKPAGRARAFGGKRGMVILAVLVVFLAAFAAHGLLTGWLGAGWLKPSDTPSAEPAAGGAVYLSDLKAIRQENWPIQLPPHPSGETPGEVIRVGGKVYPHGIFMHPPRKPNAPASLSYRLGKRFGTFRAEVGMGDGPPQSETACTFWVYGDGRLLWKSGSVQEQAHRQECAVSVKGVDVLRIAVTCPGRAHGAHMVWLDPRVTR
jgi:hypothetical protein